jgi:hypothetical protein
LPLGSTRVVTIRDERVWTVPAFGTVEALGRTRPPWIAVNVSAKLTPGRAEVWSARLLFFLRRFQT